LAAEKRLIIEAPALILRSVSSWSHDACSVMSGFSVRSAARNSRRGSNFGRRHPSILPAVREPLRSKRSTHLMATESLTPNRSAAPLQLILSGTIASITRSRKSYE
jgi:hypothetical protein